MGDAEIVPFAGRDPRPGSTGSRRPGAGPGIGDGGPGTSAVGPGEGRTRPPWVALLGEVRRLGASWGRSLLTPDRPPEQSNPERSNPERSNPEQSNPEQPTPGGPEAGPDPWTELLSFAQALGSRVVSAGVRGGGPSRTGPDGREALQSLLDFSRGRLRGDYLIDDFGFDPEFTTRVFLPLLRPLVQSWFRVEVRGAENLPADGAALLVSNHAGTMPLDGMILQTVVHDESARHLRMLGADLIFSTPYSHDLARRTGTTLACQEDAERLLAADQLVAVFPEGFKGLGKPFSDRYKLQRFGRGGFVSAAVRAQVPIIPVSIVGSEEIYPLISSAPVVARALGLPYFPVTPLFPWLGPLGLVPLPSKWIIEFGEGIATDELPAGAADDPTVVLEVTDQVRETIQQTLYALLMQRRSTWF